MVECLALWTAGSMAEYWDASTAGQKADPLVADSGNHWAASTDVQWVACLEPLKAVLTVEL